MSYSSDSDNEKKNNKKVSTKKTESYDDDDVNEKPKKKRPNWITTLDMKMEFGKYKGFKYSYIKKNDPAYCLWICEKIKDPKGSLIDFIYHYKKIELDD